MSGIFISYRRNDSAGYAGRLYDELARRFGKTRVFMDIDTLQAGLDFDHALDQAVTTSDVLLALIGPGWLRAVDAEGNRRLDDPDDLVRLEIATALGRDDIRVIPVLVGNASMPRAEALLDDLKPLARRHAFEISDARWDYDIRRLVAGLEPIVRPRRRVAIPRVGWGRGLTAAGILALMVLTWFWLAPLVGDGDDNGDETPTPTETATATATTTGGVVDDDTAVPPTPTATTEPSPTQFVNPTLEGPTIDVGILGAGTAVVSGSGVSLRADASSSAPIVSALESGWVVDVAGDPVIAGGAVWWPVIVLVTGESGWVNQEFLE